MELLLVVLDLILKVSPLKKSTVLEQKKSRIQETPNLSTDADSITDIFYPLASKRSDSLFFFFFLKKKKKMMYISFSGY